MFKIFHLFIFALLFTWNCSALELSREQGVILEKFFRIMLQESEGGYVFYGKKPICIRGFHVEDYFLQECERHIAFVSLREGAFAWKNLNQNDPNQEIIIHVYNNEDSLVKNYIHILFINKSLCIDTIKSNLSLFQYILGPDVTPHALLNQLVDPNLNFHSTLKNDKVLIGILLGFGAQNSLYGSRIENLQEGLLCREQFPFKNLLERMDVRLEFSQILLLKKSPPRENSKEQPSFGYSSLREEGESLNKKITISSLTLAKQSPPFMFGRLKEDKETDKLVSELEVTQTKIKHLLYSNNFLKEALHFLYPKEEIHIQSDSNDPLVLDESEIKKIPFLVSANIWSVFKEEGEDYRQSFIEGMKEAEKTSPAPNQSVDTLKYDKLKEFLKIKNNLQEADDYFNLLDQDVSLTSILPLRLYYKVIQEGSGVALNHQTQVLVRYAVKKPNNLGIADISTGELAEQINLSDAIPGFAWGIKGMKVGEIREIYIHPSVGYGIYTTLDKGIYLKALVQLIGINRDQKEEAFPVLTGLDLKADISSTIDLDYQEEAKKVGYSSGYQIWNHYKKIKNLPLVKVLEWISQFELEAADADISSEKDQYIINRLHWNIYWRED